MPFVVTDSAADDYHVAAIRTGNDVRLAVHCDRCADAVFTADSGRTSVDVPARMIIKAIVDHEKAAH